MEVSELATIEYIAGEMSVVETAAQKSEGIVLFLRLSVADIILCVVLLRNLRSLLLTCVHVHRVEFRCRNRATGTGPREKALD